MKVLKFDKHEKQGEKDERKKTIRWHFAIIKTRRRRRAYIVCKRNDDGNVLLFRGFTFGRKFCGEFVCWVPVLALQKTKSRAQYTNTTKSD